jgi:hypothetical protein
MGRDNEVIGKQVQLKNQKTSDKFIRKPIEIKENILGCHTKAEGYKTSNQTTSDGRLDVLKIPTTKS